MDTTIALVQFHVEPAQPEINLPRMEEFVVKAAKAGARIVVFPEDAVTGPLSGQLLFVANAPAYLLFFQQLAIKYAVDIVPGSWTTSDGLANYNTAHYINSDGSLAGSYRKINLWPTELALASPGSEVSVFPTAHGLVGLSICWDIAFPPLFTQMKQLGAKLVISPTYWSYSRAADHDRKVENDEITLTDSLCTARAFENNFVFAYCNAAGMLQTEGIEAELSGRSQVHHPVDKILCKSEGNSEEMLLAQVNLHAIV